MVKFVKINCDMLAALIRNSIPRCLCFTFFILYLNPTLAQHSTIHGIVKDADSILPAASISIANKNELTNSRGEFSITINPGSYTLLITHTGYKKIEQQIVLKAGEKQFLQFNMIRDEQVDDVIVLGSRSFVRRSNLNTVAPIDVISSTELKQTGQQSLIQMLNFAEPSFNVSRQNLFEPVTLRGLGPDHSLVLVNGIRYHSLVYVNTGSVRGVLGKGSVTNDLNSIPFSSIEKIEILRDGATAQYGSDAIAGVINIVLKKNSAKTSVNLHLGQHYKGDGENIVFGVNHGLSLNKKGFLNFSGDFRYRKSTHRGGNYEGTIYTNNKATDDSIVLARGFDRNKAVSNDGVIPLHSFGFLMNGGYRISNKVELFWTGTATYRHVAWPGTYRFPKNRNTVNTLLYPDGFKSVAVINSWDYSIIAGAKGKTRNAWNWEWKSIYGENTNEQIAENSNNASQQFTLGANAPTEFYGGTPSFMQHTNTLSFAKDLAKNMKGVKTFNLGVGVECRFEKIRSRQGEEASWRNYDSLGRTQGGAPGSGAIHPNDELNKGRTVFSSYVDLESDINDRFLVEAACRYEHYDGFGGNLAGKLGLRYKFSPLFTLRGSISNGYHAPALQQIYLSSSGNAWRNVGGQNTQIRLGIFQNNSDVAKAFGVKPLEPEKSLNVGAGFTSTFSPHINLTVDGYWIQIQDRLVLSGRFDKAANADVRKILDYYSDVDQVQFMTNAINTRNIGVDLVLNGNWRINKSTLQFMLAANFNRTNLFGSIQTADSLPPNPQNTNTLFNREEKIDVEKTQPTSKIILSGNYAIGKLSALIRFTRFGKTAAVFDSNDESRDEFFLAKLLTDLSISYTAFNWLTLTLGANNLFNVYPDKLRNYLNTSEGILVYSNRASPFGFNGGYYFVTMSFNF